MSQSEKKSIATAATFVLVAAAVVSSLHLLGQFALSRMLEQDAVAVAELWSRTGLKGGVEALVDAVRKGDGRVAGEQLKLAHIDALALISPTGGIEPVGPGAPAAAEHLEEVLSAAAQDNAARSEIATAAYTGDALRWLAHGPFRTWVVFPPEDGAGPRLALRIDQTQMAAALADSFVREVLFSGGVAVITFASFMAGFHYRQRKLAAENAAIRHLALHDELTGLPNRKQFEEFTVAALESGAQEGHKSALFVLDLDGFKAVNDTLGHPVGDGLLKATAKRLKASLRTGDLLARLSGDEFAIVVPKMTDSAMLAPLAERILHLASNPFRVDGHEVQVGCSIGIAVAPDNGKDIGALMRNADYALYRAKSEGRRTWRFFDPKMAEDLAGRRTLEDGLRHALHNDLFQLLYQPQVELATGRTLGYEAMLRWRLPGKGLVPASIFLPIAEETGLVVPIGEWVIRQVGRDCALIPSERSISINLSANQLKRDGIEVFIAETLRSHRVPPNRILVEVNEAILGRNENTAFERLETIRNSGISIVMDSFGVGAISLGLLSRYSFDKIKVDRSFLLHDEQKSGAVLAAITSLGRSLGFRVSGQGVETIEHAQLLRAAGCSEAQGYYFGPPMPLEQVLRVEQEFNAMPLAATA